MSRFEDFVRVVNMIKEFEEFHELYRRSLKHQIHVISSKNSAFKKVNKNPYSHIKIPNMKIILENKVPKIYSRYS